MGSLFVLPQGASAALRSPSQETALQNCVLPRQSTSIRTLNISRGASLDRENSSLSHPNLDQELKELKLERVAMRPQHANDKYPRETALRDGDTHLVEFSDALQTVAKALREVAEGKARALDEAAQWKRRFEIERLRNAHLENLAAAYASRDSFRQEEPPDLQNPETDAGEPRAFIERLESNLSCYSKEGIRNQQVLRTHSSSMNNLSSDSLLDERVYLEKALFTLKWGSTGVKSTKHKHDIVSFESGDITTAVRTNKQITLVWDSPPQSVFILTKPNASNVQILCKEMVRWLKEEKGIRVYVEPIVKAELLKDSSYFDFVQTCKSEEEVLDLHNKVDLVITLGGDGTVLWAASMFKGSVPPVVSFSLGSLGFMTQFQSDRFRECLHTVLKGPVYITLRHRLHCQIVLHPDNMKAVQGDGLILSTPSGSTAYSLAAGGSMVHPQVPGILFTPICPHSLSFRPLILPEHVTLRVQVPVSSRGQAWASFDGKSRQQLGAGDALVVRMSAWPVPTACEQESSNDFLRSVREGLHWNLRKSQLLDGPRNSN